MDMYVPEIFKNEFDLDIYMCAECVVVARRIAAADPQVAFG